MLQTLFQKFAEIGNNLVLEVQPSFDTPQPSAFPTSVEAACLQHIQMSATKKFDDTCSNHMAHLHRLWRAWYSLDPQTHQPVTPPPIEMPSELWKHIGFQRSNPISDIRGGAELSIKNLAYFAEVYPHTLLQLRTNKLRRYKEMKHEIPSYPIAAAGINITRLLTDIFNIVEPLSGNPKWFCQEQLPYYRFLASEASGYVEYTERGVDYFKMGEKAFNEMFCFVFQYLDWKWDMKNASYMDFNVVLQEVRQDLVNLLSAAPPHASLWWLRMHTGLFVHSKDFTPYPKLTSTTTAATPKALVCDRGVDKSKPRAGQPSQPSNFGDFLDISAGTCESGSMVFATTAF